LSSESDIKHCAGNGETKVYVDGYIKLLCIIMGIILEQVIPFYEAREEAMKYIRLKEDKEGCEVKSVDKIIGKLFILPID
jgi:hypothetical protein